MIRTHRNFGILKSSSFISKLAFMHQLILGEKKLQNKIHYLENKVCFSYYFDYDYLNPEKKPQRKIITK